jgi:DNA-binding FrmR family transcriptional regulator
MKQHEYLIGLIHKLSLQIEAFLLFLVPPLTGKLVFAYGRGVCYTGVNKAKEAATLEANHNEHSDSSEAANHCSPDEHRKSHHSEKTKANLVARLNRIEGQIRGVKGLIDKDTYCDDVLNQIAAIQSALNGVGKLLLEGHMKSCVVERIQSGDHEVIDELLITVKKLMK